MGNSAFKQLSGLTLVCLMALAISSISPFDRTTWWLEVAPVLIALPVLWATLRRFPLTPLLYVCIGWHALVLIMGGTYSYARVPLGFELQSWLDLSRNPYDKIGHFTQGFVPALVAREILLRGGYVQGRRMLAFLVLTSVTFSLFGFIIGIWADGFEKLQIIPLMIITPLTFLGGTFYSIKMLPPFWQAVTLFNPVVYLVSAFRWAFYGAADVSVGVSVGMTLVFLLACLLGVRWIFKTGYRLKT